MREACATMALLALLMLSFPVMAHARNAVASAYSQNDVFESSTADGVVDALRN